MPLYEYKCDNCGDLFEVMQKFADAPLTTHEKCGGPAHRLLSVPALQFKGSGFYITDYAKGGGEKPAPNGSPDKSDNSGKAAKKDAGSTGTGEKPASTSSETKNSPSTDTK